MKYYYNVDGNDFVEFFKAKPTDIETMPTAGPFDTFAEVKKDALEWFNVSIEKCREAMVKIPSTTSKRGRRAMNTLQKHITATYIIATILAGCGEIKESKDTPVTQAVTQTEQRGPKGDKGERGLSCTTEDSEQGAKIICEDGTEAFVADGAPGVAGESGEKGEQGEKGDTGSVGPQGVAGPQGPEGSVSTVVVEDATGGVIGELVYMDTTGFAVVMENGLRAKVDNFGWTETMRTYFADPGCAGERRAVMLNGQFGNFWIDEFAGDGTYWKLNSDNLGSFTYQSREDGDGVCDAAGGSITNSFTVQEGLTLPFTLPFANPPRIGGNE